ncbi:Gfo/Idh/MocA family protein [Arthrobacter castelli]|uniref:Gfo/Idh/MocA family protein n=1 Tax=Arthrobacter castelli TaxID=271431 RepID=UPI0004012AA3|nr:Gfo/Idh/MocA family oxidoreductase [Arthrobacter castelli]
MVSSRTDLRLGVIGLGARHQLASLAHNPGNGSRIVAVCDPITARRESARKTFGNDLVMASNHRDLLNIRLDGVFIITPDATHAELAIDFLQSGIAVYIEKPLAITTDEADRVLQTAQSSGTPLYVGHNMRYMPFTRLMRDVISKGDIGEVKSIWCRHFVGHGGDYYFKDWHAERSKVTSLLLQKGAHDIDIIHWLAGGYTNRLSAFGNLSVYGQIEDRSDRSSQVMQDWFSESNWPPLAQQGLNPLIDVEDLSVVNLQLDNNIIATYQQCHFTPDYWRNYTVIGTEGRLENFGDDKDATIKVWNRRSNYRAEGDKELAVSEESGTHGGSDRRIITEFLDFLRGGSRTETSPVAARYAVATGVAATESLRAGGTVVTVPHLAPELNSYFECIQKTDQIKDRFKRNS